MQARQAEGQEEKVSKDDDDPQLIGEAKTAMNDVLDINASSFSELSLGDRVTMLNGDQRRIFDNVKAHLLHQQCHETNQRRRQQFGVEGARLRTGSAHLCSYDTCTRARYVICYLHAHIYMYIVVARFETHRVHAAAAATHILSS